MDNTLIFGLGAGLVVYLGYKGILMDLLYGTLYYAFRGVQYTTQRSMLARWRAKSLAQKGTIILHRFDPAQTIPNLSCFVMKLETYMRMANIPYQIDTSDPLGPKGKSPWISYNGEHYTDSQLIIEWLQKQFGHDLNKQFTKEQRALATVVRVTMNEYLFWPMSMWAFWQDRQKNIYKIVPNLKFYEYGFLRYNVIKISWGHGIGRHSEADIVNLISNAMRAISTLLGEKKFLLGNEPCIEDADVFGLMAQIFWGLGIGSPYEKLVDEELPNIRSYCERMREKFWPDWKECLAK